MSDYLALAMQAQEKNRETLIAALRAQGICMATVDYAGAGDSGDTCDLAVQPPEHLATLKGLKVNQHRVDVQFLSHNQRACSLREQEVALDEAVRDFAMRWVDSLHGGWENDDGASGTVIFNITEDALHLEHTSYYTESERYEHDM